MSDLDAFETGDELADNPTTRLPVCLCLDVSGSMDGRGIFELNKGVKVFYEHVNKVVQARQSADVCIVTFGDNVRVEQEFGSIDGEEPKEFSADGGTPMGEAVNKALDLLDARKQEYKSKGIKYNQPWLVLITDGVPTDDHSRAAARTAQLCKDSKLSVFAVGVEGYNIDVLKDFSPTVILEPDKLNFEEFFKFLAASVAVVSQSRPGDEVSLPPVPQTIKIKV